jgi:putative PIN family toxin of toxin-antitoxin system
MRAVLDTNVVVSGLLSEKGPCGVILDSFFQDQLQLCVDGRILIEYDDVLPRPLFKILPERVTRTLDLFCLKAEYVDAPPLTLVLPDPSDLPFLEVAAAAGAILVTGNVKHFPKRARAGVTVMTPKEFLDSLRRAS